MFKMMKSVFNCTNMKQKKSIKIINLFLNKITNMLPNNRHHYCYIFSMISPFVFSQCRDSSLRPTNVKNHEQNCLMSSKTISSTEKIVWSLRSSWKPLNPPKFDLYSSFFSVCKLSISYTVPALGKDEWENHRNKY